MSWYNKKIKYSKIEFDDSKFLWCYSADEFCDILNRMFVGKTLEKVYVSLVGYMESFHHSENYYDFSYMGGLCAMIFESHTIIFSIHCQGLIKYKIINTDKLNITECFDYPEGGLDSYEFYDLENQFELKFANCKVSEITVDSTDSYSFFLDGYGLDEQKLNLAAETKTLPDAVHFHLDNGVDFGIYGDETEYYNIELNQCFL